MLEEDRVPYDFDEAFERSVTYHAVTNQQFWGLIGRYLNANLVTAKESRLALEASQAVFARTGVGPGSTKLVMQHLRTLNENGVLLSDDVEAVRQFLIDGGTDTDLPSVDGCVQMLAPKLKERAREALTKTMMGLVRTKSEDLSSLRNGLDMIDRIGRVDMNIGTLVDADDFGDIDALHVGERLPSGVPDLDTLTGGGLARGGVLLIGAKTGGGKTSSLIHWAANGVVQRLVNGVAYASLEVKKGDVQLGFRANISGIPRESIGRPGPARDRSVSMFKKAAPAPIVIKKFPAHRTKWEDIVEWYEDLEQRLGFLPEILVVDFLGKLGHKNPRMPKHEQVTEIMDAMHDYAGKKGIYLLTASQAQRNKDKNQDKLIIGTDDLNQGQGKVEGSSLFISLNWRSDGRELYYWVGKHRGPGHNQGVGPLPHDLGCARLVPMSYMLPPKDTMKKLDQELWDELG